MRPKWTGDLLGDMHNNEVTQEDIARELGVCKSYISMILRGARTPADAKERLQAAYKNVLMKRKYPEA